MKIDIDEVSPTKKEIFQVGNVIDNDGDLYLVVKTWEGYSLLDFEIDQVGRSYKTLSELAEEFGDENDTLVNVKIVRA